MINHNQQTIETYNHNAELYVESSPQVVSGDMKAWLDTAVYGLSYDANILEIGTAGGRDAAYLESLGYAVERTDATPAFVDRLQKRGYPARLLDILNDPIDDNYDLVFANAVLLHVNRDEMTGVAGKVYDALNQNGRFAMTLKPGQGESWSSAKLDAPRYFCHWERPGIERVLSGVGFVALDFVPDQNGWVQLVAQKDYES